MNTIILAGGFGTRLYPLTLGKPKALLDIGGKCLLDHLMENVAKTRPDSVLIVTNNRFYEQFVYWKSFQKYAFPIHILNNGINSNDERNGAVLDLYYAVCDSRVRGSEYLVLASDNYFDYPLNHFILQALHHMPRPVLAAYDVKVLEQAKKYGVIEMNEDHIVTSFDEKPRAPKSSLVSAGVYFLPKEIPFMIYKYLKIYKHEPDRLGDFITWLYRMVPTVAIRIEGVWKGIGNMESYLSLTRQ